jgi:peroxiredoxin
MRIVKFFCCIAIAMTAISLALTAAPDDVHAPNTRSPDAETAWMEFRNSLEPPPAPRSWQNNPPSKEVQAKFYLPYILSLQEKAKDFYTRFGNDKHAIDARKQELELTGAALQLGATNQQAQFDALEKSLLNDPALAVDDRFAIRKNDIDRLTTAKEPEGAAAAKAEYEKGVRQLQKEFPNHPGAMQMLIEVARDSEPSKARAILQEVASSSAPDYVKQQAAGEVKKLDAVGKPMDLQFTAVDGREVDLAKLKGKVVLIDFWATWCRPCVRELPHVKEAYDKLHSKGFEIVGVSLDKDKGRLTRFVDQHGMAWPQFFDGLYWQNKFAVQFNIESIPAMWLVDKKGVLRSINARADLSGEVTKLLAE